MAINFQGAVADAKKFGNVEPGQNSGGNKQANQWQRMLAQLAMAGQMNPQTMMGFALGGLLRKLFDNWKERYDTRGEWKSAMQNMDEGKRNQWWAELQQNNPKRYAYLSKRYGGLAPNLPRNDATPQPPEQNNPSFERLSGILSTPEGKSNFDAAMNRAKEFDLTYNLPEVNNPFDEDELIRNGLG